jgi:hypothetical protein
MRRSTYAPREAAEVLGVPLSQVQEWRRRGIVVPVEAGGLLHRNDVALGAVVLALQKVLGAKSPLVFRIAAQVRPKLADWLRWDSDPPVPGALTVFYDEEVIHVRIDIPAKVFDALAVCLD